MKKFTRLVESKEYLGHSVETIKKDFKDNLNPSKIEVYITTYTSNSGEDVHTVGVLDISPESVGINIDDDLFSPIFSVYIGLLEKPESSDLYEYNGVQSDNWLWEDIKFDLISKEFKKLSDLLEKYNEDFYVFLHSENINTIGLSANSQYLISLSLSLIMKDQFEFSNL